MNRWKIDTVLALFREAGEIALRYYDDPPLEIKADHTPVTQADREIEALFAARFDRPAEALYLIGEETVDRRDEAYISAALPGSASWSIPSTELRRMRRAFRSGASRSGICAAAC